jgi:hypothetical protein
LSGGSTDRDNQSESKDQKQSADVISQAVHAFIVASDLLRVLRANESPEPAGLGGFQRTDRRFLSMMRTAIPTC